MSSLTIQGNTRLKGTIAVTGNKNEALPLIAASLLCSQPVTFSNVPDIGDVQAMLSIARHLGAEVSPIVDGKVTICAKKIKTSTLPLEISSKIRGSILFASSLLVRTGKAAIPQPGGDGIGARRIDTHFLVFKALGAKLTVSRDKGNNESGTTTFCITAPKGLTGTDIYLDEASVTATENAVIVAAGSRGKTVIANAACEPHVQGLCRFLQKIGVTIEGIGSNMLTVHGIDSFHCTGHHAIGGDYIEAGSFIGLAACTRSELTITGINPPDMRMILFQFGRLGVKVECDVAAGSLYVNQKTAPVIKRDFGSAIPKIEDSPWPAFPADLTSILVVTATQCKGICLIHEKMFEGRLFFIDRLISMGAQIVLCDPHRAVVAGPSHLYGATIISPDIRAGMAMLIAACAAQGTTIIHNAQQIDRGYEKIDKRLNAIGADITRVVERRTGS